MDDLTCRAVLMKSLAVEAFSSRSITSRLVSLSHRYMVGTRTCKHEQVYTLKGESRKICELSFSLSNCFTSGLRIRTFLVGSGSGKFPPDPDPIGNLAM